MVSVLAPSVERVAVRLGKAKTMDAIDKILAKYQGAKNDRAMLKSIGDARKVELSRKG